jgi:hypothetical protein
MATELLLLDYLLLYIIIKIGSKFGTWAGSLYCMWGRFSSALKEPKNHNSLFDFDGQKKEVWQNYLTLQIHAHRAVISELSLVLAFSIK